MNTEANNLLLQKLLLQMVVTGDYSKSKAGIPAWAWVPAARRKLDFLNPQDVCALECDNGTMLDVFCMADARFSLEAQWVAHANPFNASYVLIHGEERAHDATMRIQAAIEFLARIQTRAYTQEQKDQFLDLTRVMGLLAQALRCLEADAFAEWENVFAAAERVAPPPT